MALINHSNVLQFAREICDRTGNRLTETRLHMLQVLMTVNTPMSAYELTDHYNSIIDQPIMAMSVYRILDFLESIHLVHRLHSINKYVLCHHLEDCHEHHPALFIICRTCQHTQQLSLSPGVLDVLSQQALHAGFKATGSQLELTCLCEKCQPSFSQQTNGTYHD